MSGNPLPGPEKDEKPQGYYASGKQYAAQTYNNQYEKWMPWMEDKYLAWFGKDNKASYVAKDSLDKTKITGIDQVDKLQDGVNSLAAGQIGKGGLGQPIGDAVSKEGINRAERGGKDEEGRTVPGSGSVGPVGDVAEGVAEGGKGLAGGVTEGGKGLGSGVVGGAKGAGGYVGGMFGGGKGGEAEGKK